MPTMRSGDRSSRPRGGRRIDVLGLAIAVRSNSCMVFRNEDPPCLAQARPRRKNQGSERMSVNNKRVFYVKYLAHPVYTEIMQARPDIRFDRLENESPDEVAAPIISSAHV